MSRWSRYRTSAAMAATVALGLAGCGSTTHGSVPTTSAPPRSTTTARVPTPSFSTGCTTVELTLSITGPVGTAGAEHYELVFHNSSSSTCTLYGYPGVSFLDSAGAQIGPPAERATSAPVKLITLVPDADAYSGLKVTDPGIPPCSGAGTVAHVRVCPPNDTSAGLVAPPLGCRCARRPTPRTILAPSRGLSRAPRRASSSSGRVWR